MSLHDEKNYKSLGMCGSPRLTCILEKQPYTVLTNVTSITKIGEHIRDHSDRFELNLSHSNTQQ
jgi:hypothetical protein